jgi:hypothetical protein
MSTQSVATEPTTPALANDWSLSIGRTRARNDSQTAADQPGGWQDRAITAYLRVERDEAAYLQADLSARVLALTSITLTESSIYVDHACRFAVVALDGVVFRLERKELVVVRPCSYCGWGEFASPPISNLVDLGYALSGWQPRCPDCTPADPPEDW